MGTSDKPRILLIDESELVRLCLVDYLSRAGFDAFAAASGEEALRLLGQNDPALIILDVMIGGLGGLGFLKRISDADGRPKYPILILTERPGIENFAQSVHAAGCLHKSVSGEELLARIREILTGRNASPRTAQGRRSRPRILLAEDDERLANVIRQAFVEAGFTIEVTANGPALLRQAAAGTPDALVIKELLPGMNGHLAAARFGETPAGRNIPVVLYDQTRNGEAGDPHYRLPANIRAYLTTYEARALIDAVHEVLS